MNILIHKDHHERSWQWLRSSISLLEKTTVPLSRFVVPVFDLLFPLLEGTTNLQAYEIMEVLLFAVALENLERWRSHIANLREWKRVYSPTLLARLECNEILDLCRELDRKSKSKISFLAR
jgi:hypothetical protein